MGTGSWRAQQKPRNRSAARERGGGEPDGRSKDTRKSWGAALVESASRPEGRQATCLVKALHPRGLKPRSERSEVVPESEQGRNQSNAEPSGTALTSQGRQGGGWASGDQKQRGAEWGPFEASAQRSGLRVPLRPEPQPAASRSHTSGYPTAINPSQRPITQPTFLRIAKRHQIPRPK